MTTLPFPDSPMFLCYHSRAFPFGIIQANNTEDITKWICTKCVNCVYTTYDFDHMFDMIIDDEWGSSEELVTHQNICIDMYKLKQPNFNLISMMKSFIFNGYYIFGLYNEKYIPGKRVFQKKDYLHDFLVIGCDKDKFISVGYLADGRFKRFEIPNQNMLDSLCKTRQLKIKLKLIKYNENALPKPNYNSMIGQLEHYIAQADQVNIPMPVGVSYGIAAISHLRDYFVDEVENKGKIYLDRRYVRVLMEQKWVLSQLIENFLDIEENQKLSEFVTKNFERAKCIHLLGLKMQYTQNRKIINQVENLMNEIIHEELEYIPELIKVLKEKYQ